MFRRVNRVVMGAVVGLLVLAAIPAYGAGFGIFEQGTKATGMAGAFTAQADDPSAMFYNVAGLAFQREAGFAVGTTLITFQEAKFNGADPNPGVGTTEEQKDVIFYPSHIYYVRPVGDAWTLGFHFNNPFGLKTEWKDTDNYTGRFLSYLADLKVYDLGINAGWQVSPTFGLGIGVLARGSEVILRRRVGVPNPFTGGFAEVADLKLESDLDWGYGFVVGLLGKPNDRWSWGLSYRSKVTLDYGGHGRFTQIPTGIPPFDGVIGSLFPFDQNVPIATGVEYPDMASFGIAFKAGSNALVEIDVNWAGWSSFDEVVLTFTEHPQFSSTLEQKWDDCFNYRIGLNWPMASGNELRFGYVYDETPQPDEGVGPLLPDANRNGFTVGYGFKGARLGTDLALMYLPFDERTTTTNHDHYYGTYNTTAWLLGATLTW